MTVHSQTAFRTLLGAAGVFACAAFTLPSAALSAEAPPSRTIVYSDLDMASIAGRQEFEHRLQNAASAVCFTDSRELAMIAEAGRCRTEVIAQAHRKVDTKTVLAAR